MIEDERVIYKEGYVTGIMRLMPEIVPRQAAVIGSYRSRSHGSMKTEEALGSDSAYPLPASVSANEKGRDSDDPPAPLEVIDNQSSPARRERTSPWLP